MKFYRGFLLICISASFFFCPVAKAVDYAQEWLNSSAVLDIINAKAAYENGITGLGISVGVIDQMINVSHAELLGKATSNIGIFDDGTIFIPDWALNAHGSHVAGIIAAAKDGEGMFGVAYDSSIAGLVYLASAEVDGETNYFNFTLNIEQFFQDNPDMRIVNNSWGSTFYPFEFSSNATIDQDRTIAEVFSLFEKYSVSSLTDLADYAISHPEVLLIFAAGNDGQMSAYLEGLLPRYYGSELNNFISVGSLDSAYITVANDSSITMDSSGISTFSNLALGAERWTVFAPGNSIYSLDAATGGYMYMSGTSMAAPVVSGTAALVQQVFPWMTGVQLASTILSTANNSFTAPEYIISHENLNGYDYFYIRYIDADGTPTPTNDEVKAILSHLLDTSLSYWQLTEEEKSKYIDYIIDTECYEVQYLTKEQVFGQGIVDVAKAIGGIAELDANRMTKENAIYVSELDTSYAIDNFNTAGYNAVFSNDISQFKWDDYYHHEEYQTTATTGYNAAALALDGLDVGIMKSGAGTLVLTGNNTYAGATVIEGGILALMQTSAENSGTLTASSVVVRSGGTFTGDGIIASNQTLYNAGTVVPGADLLSWYTTASTNNNTLTVMGDYTQTNTGTLEIYFNPNNYQTHLHVGGDATLAGTLAFTPQINFYLDASTITMSDYLKVSGVATNAFNTIKVTEISPTLSFTLSAVDSTDNLTDYAITTSRKENAYSQYALDSTGQSIGNALYSISKVATGDMQNLYTALDFNANGASGVSNALTQLSPETYGHVTSTSFYQQNSYNANVLQHMTFNSYAQQNIANTNVYNVADNILANVTPIVVADATDVASRSADHKNWKAWGSVIGSYTQQNSSGDARDFDSIATGLIAGYDYHFSDAFTFGTHAVFVAQKLTADDVHDAITDSVGMHIGVHGRYAPSDWNGVYINGLARIGFEYSEMERTVEITGITSTYVRSNESNWTDFLGTVLLGIGKDWQKNNIYYGPVAWAEYVLLSRPSITETGNSAGANATRLSTEGDVYHSLLLSAGAHVGTFINLNENAKISADFLAAWQYDALGDDWETKASFVDYNAYTFTSTTDRLNHNSLLLQASMLFEKEYTASTFFLEGTLKANLFNESNTGTNVSGGINVGLRF